MCGCAEACMQKRECDPCISFSWLPTSGTKTTREPTHKSRSGIQDRCPPALLQWPVRCRHNSNTPWPRLLIDINPATRVQELAVQVFGGEYTETLKMVGGAQRSTCLGAFFFSSYVWQSDRACLISAPNASGLSGLSETMRCSHPQEDAHVVATLLYVEKLSIP